jgi:hypothetical protein
VRILGSLAHASSLPKGGMEANACLGVYLHPNYHSGPMSRSSPRRLNSDLKQRAPGRRRT